MGSLSAACWDPMALRETRSFFLDHVSVPQEGADDTLDAFDTVLFDWISIIGICRLLGIGALGYGGMLARRELGLGGLCLAVSGKEFLDVAWNTHAKSAFGVVPVKVHAKEFGNLLVLMDSV